MFTRAQPSTPSTADAAFQNEVGRRLLERLDGLSFEPKQIVDLGCAQAAATTALKRRYRSARVLGVDYARDCLSRAQRRQGRWRRAFELVQADACHLPLASASVDLIHASLLLPFCSDLTALLNGVRRVMRPGGLLLLSTLGPDSLGSLRERLNDHDLARYPYRFADVQTLGNALMRSGFAEPVLDTDWITVQYRQSTDLLRALRAMDPAIRLGGDRSALRQFRRHGGTADGFSAEWEVVYATAWGPQDGAPMRDETGGEVASVAVENIGRRER
ncbi:MAG: methyltransferase domain-containing protein [Pseudomonadota bacterium]